MKHTPGRWIIDGMYVRSDFKNRMICMIPTYPLRIMSKTDEGNAHLIAAAPNLLKVAELLQQACAFDEGDTVSVVDGQKLYEAFLESGFAYREAVYGTLDPEEIGRLHNE